MKSLLIDGDIVLYVMAFRNQKTFAFPGCEPTVQVDEEKARADVDSFILQLLGRTGCKDYLLCFTNRHNFRYAILPTYKHNRANSTPPELIRPLKAYMKDKHPWRSEPLLEADDLMGILGTKYPGKYVLATIDKDFECLPITLFNWRKDRFPRQISEQHADYRFHWQWLVGDPGDGYKGCYRVGAKGADKALKGCKTSEEMTEAVLELYAAKCYHWDDIIAQARMARILRAEDYDFDRKEPILWTPK